ncbi:lipase family protein [Leucobacter denitrificans]|uniref:DUF308 domain-containing protein n=1 Tax=Leucobacter denitrificans TaxID=683042 RepID=A0A7G9S4I9_9MICO|nr:lipase family protein [Leucobacter denitrificans]QNN62764.1 DUF308 domain-containing protein [Leucobacter denitrificans]
MQTEQQKFRGPARVVLAAAAIGLGLIVIMTPLSPQGVAVAVGIGIACSGILLIVAPSTQNQTTRSVLPLVAGVMCMVLGAVVALWPDAGAPWLALLVAVAIIVFGIHTATRAIRQRTDQSVASLISAFAAILIGVVAFSWPVLTLSVFRVGFGGWLVFIGAQALLQLIFARRSTRRRPPTRGWIRTAAASLALVLACGFALGSAWIFGGAPLAAPGAFYTPPADVSDTPGTLIRVEPLDSGVPAEAEGYRILYTTTHADGSPAISSGTVLLPARRGTDPLPLISVAHGTTGVDPKCAPSLSATPFSDGAAAALEQMVVEHGWAAVTSDYIGLGTEGPHPYLVGDAEARNVLDATRAAHELADVTLADRTVVWGHSQGGQGALWTGQIADAYAPEITIEGIAAFAPAADLYGLADADKNDAAGKTVSAYIAATWNDLYPELDLDEHLTAGSAVGVERISQLCFNGKDVLAAIIRGTQVTNQVFPDSTLAGEFGDMLKAQTPVGPFPAPVLVAQGLDDPLVKPQLQDRWVEARCAEEEAIDYRTYAGFDHVSVVSKDSPLTPELIDWTLARWSGDAPTPNC